MAKNQKALEAQNDNLEFNQESTQELTPLQIAQQAVEQARAQLKALKEAEKEAKAKKETKGVMVTFTNQAGETITGKGVLYYVTRVDKKLHYKEASQVKVLTPDEIEALNL